MELYFDTNAINSYKSQSQIIRVLTEQWVKTNSFCPNCGYEHLSQFSNNKPVADFFCNYCHQEYELKSQNGILKSKIADGAYNSMITRIESSQNPNFFFLTYNKTNWQVRDFLIIPKYYFIPNLIEKRNPLSDTARRAGWIGCNILLNKIPSTGRIFLIRNSIQIKKETVLHQWKNTNFISDINNNSKGWLIDILNCIDLIQKETFKLEEIYKFTSELKQKHPKNNYIKDKIRQQLQLLRDKDVVEFVTKGVYKKRNLIYDTSR